MIWIYQKVKLSSYPLMHLFVRCSQICEIRYRPHFVWIFRSCLNPPSQNDLLSKGWRFADIKASAEASHKTHACISLKQRDNSRNYGQVCYLERQMAGMVGFEPTVHATKKRCLTTWPHPSSEKPNTQQILNLQDQKLINLIKSRLELGKKRFWPLIL